MAMYEKLKNFLLEAGLSESEVFVYVDLLKNPAQTKWEVVKRTGLNRNKVYRAFDKLERYKMVLSTENGLETQSLKVLVSELYSSSRKMGKLATKIKNVAPYLRMANESVSEFEVLYTQDQIVDAYLMMAGGRYNTCLDFGDLEKFVPVLGGLSPVFQFRQDRSKHANNTAICTTTGPYTECMARQKDLNKFKATLDIVDMNFDDKWVIFSDDKDQVMINDMSDKDLPCSVLMNSKVFADLQRTYFRQFSQLVEKM
ncbi:hypothetical protein HOG17_05575 [Candidatus Peregrinibacteria bacterium]|jgi:hypothetical protein|nr:hypothetical protein [Candidatus Peregrinibacteria bacterium]MBT4148027.1 hypothetical protein [Candidatus Peregrinibacteria bacterium]MBT4366615.1 hypothetical protein [Candidatus Peregrinibacteria bacterium]MBT4455602.1 hypothetical protein [Candidatus Peregrinibacteria bacterium]